MSDPLRYDYVVQGLTADATVLHVESPGLFGDGDVLLVPRTGEMLLVVDAARSPLAVRRGISSDPFEIAAGDELLICGNVGSVR